MSRPPGALPVKRVLDRRGGGLTNREGRSDLLPAFVIFKCVVPRMREAGRPTAGHGCCC